MRKYALIIMAFLFLLAVSAVASEDTRTQFDMIISASEAGDTLEIHAALPQDAQGIVNYTVDGKNYTVNVENGDAKLTIPDPDPGSYIIKANYSGDGNYLSVENQTEVIINGTAPDTDNASGAPVNDTNTSDVVENSTDDSQNASGEPQNSTNNTIIIIDNSTNISNNTPANNDTQVMNATAVHRTPQKPEPNQNSWLNQVKTGIPVILVIIALAVIVILRKYQF